MRQMHVSGLAIDLSTKSPVIILADSEEDNSSVLPIWIGHAEAAAIAMKLADVELKRPMTHDLMKLIIDGFDGKVVKVVINDLQQDAELTVQLSVLRGEKAVSKQSQKLALAALVFALGRARPRRGSLLALLRDLYPLLLFAYLYNQTGLLNQAFFHGRFDELLAAWDRAVFGADIGLDFCRHLPQLWVREVMHAFYFSYYFLVPVVAVYYLLRCPRPRLRALVFCETVPQRQGFFFCAPGHCRHGR